MIFSDNRYTPGNPLAQEFPRPFERAYPLTKFHSQQLDLFSSSLEGLSRETGISIEEMQRWYGGGISSIEPKQSRRYHAADRAELLFLRGLMRSGMPEERVKPMLCRLEKPYAYHPYATVYSFTGERWYGLDPGQTAHPYYCYQEFWRRVMTESDPRTLIELRHAIDRRLHEIDHQN